MTLAKQKRKRPYHRRSHVGWSNQKSREKERARYQQQQANIRKHTAAVDVAEYQKQKEEVAKAFDLIKQDKHIAPRSILLSKSMPLGESNPAQPFAAPAE